MDEHILVLGGSEGEGGCSTDITIIKTLTMSLCILSTPLNFEMRAH